MMTLEPDVVVESDRCVAPVGMGERFRRERLHRGTVERLEELLARRSEVAADAGVQAGDLVPDRCIQFLEAEELPVA